MFEVGDKVVYPQHGAGEIVNRETRSLLGVEREYLTIRIIASDMTVMVPAAATEASGLRAVITSEEIDEVLAALRGDDVVVAGNWNRRFKHNRDKLRSGEIAEQIEVIRSLINRSTSKPLSSGERQMLSRTKRILASEIQYAKDLDEHEALAYLEEIIEEVALERETAAARAAE